MRPKALSGSIAKYSRGLALSVLTLIGVSQAPGEIYYWDSNTTTGGFGNTTGVWGSSNFLNTDITGGAGGSFFTATTNEDTLNFGTATLNYAQASVTVSETVAASSIVYGAGQTTGITISGGTKITLGNGTPGNGGITLNNGTGAQTISTPIELNNSQSWTNNSSSNLIISGTVSGTGSPTLTNNGTGSGSVSIAGTLGSSVTKVVQDSATSTLLLRNGGGNNAFGSLEIKKGTVGFGNGGSFGATNLGAGTVTLGNSAGGNDAATLAPKDNNNISFGNAIVLAANTTGLLKIRLEEDSTSTANSKTFTGGITGNNSLTIENNGGTGAFADTITFSTNPLNFTGSLTHIGTGTGDSTISSVIGLLVAGVTQNSATSRMVLSGANTYTGATTINAGTLALSGAAGAIAASTTINLNGGTLTLTNTSASEALVNRVSNSASIISNGGSITVTNTASGTTVYSETMGSLDLRSGQLNITQTNANTTPAQTLTFGSNSLTNVNGAARTSATTSAITFSGTSLGLNARNSIIITGQATSAVGEIIAPWATWGTAAASQTDYATYNRTAGGVANTFGVQNAAIAATAQSAWSTDYTTGTGTLNNTLANASGTATNGRLSATRNINTLRNTTTNSGNISTDATTDVVTLGGSSFSNGDVVVLNITNSGLVANVPYYVRDVSGTTFKLALTSGGTAVDITGANAGQLTAGITLGANNLGTLGILNGSVSSLAIGSSGGAVTLPTTTAGNLYITTGSGDITIGAPITNNTGALTLVKNGANVLVLTGTNTFTGGLTLNSGEVRVSSDANLGAASGQITFAANSTLRVGIDNIANVTSSRQINLNGGTATFSTNFGTASTPSSFSTSEKVTGSGAIKALTINGSGLTVSLNSASNDFTGAVIIDGNNAGGNADLTVNAFSLADATGSGNIQFGRSVGVTQQFIYTGTSDLTLNNRKIEFTATSTGSGSSVLSSTLAAINVNTDLVVAAGASNRLTLNAPTGITSAFNGKLIDGTLSTLITKTGAGTWVLTGANTYTGATTISVGTLQLSTLNNASVAGPLGAAHGVGGLVLNGGTLRYTGGSVSTTRNFALTASSTLDASGTAALNFSQTGIVSPDQTLTGNFATTQKVVTGLSSTANLAVGMRVTGTNIAGSSTIQSIDSATQITLSNNTTGAGSGTSLGFGYVARTLTLTGTNTDANTISGILQDSSAAGAGVLGLTKSGIGQWVLSGANTYTGATTVNRGTLLLDMTGSGALAATSTLTLGGGNFQVKGNGTASSVTAQTLGALTLTAATNSTITLDPNNSGAGSTTLTLGNALTRNAGSSLFIDTSSANTGTRNVKTTGAITGTGAAVGGLLNYAVVKDATGTGFGVQDGSFNIVRKTAGFTTLTTSNSVAGSTAVDFTTVPTDAGYTSGVLTLGNVAHAANTLSIDSTGGGTLDLGGAQTLSLTAKGILMTGAGNYIIQTGTVGAAASEVIVHQMGSGTLTINSLIGSTSAFLTKDGPGTLRLGSTGNTYTGVTTVTGGTLEVVRIATNAANSSIGNPASTAADRLLLGNGTTLRFIGDGSGTDTTDRNWTLNGTSDGDSATLDASGAGTERVTFSNTSSPAYGTNNQTRTINLAGTNTSANTLAANIANNGTGAVSLTKSGVGTWVLTGNSVFTGSTTISNGILEVTANNALGTNAAGTTVANGATLKLTGVNYSTAEGLIINGTGVSGGALESSGTTTFAGLITAATSATINAISGTLELSGGLVKNGTTLTFTGAGAFTISSVISGASANSDLAVDATTVTLTAANTYNGPTEIKNGGTLNANVLGALPLTPRSAMSFTGTGTSALNLGANQFVASLSSAGAATVALGSNTLTIGITGGNTTFAGSISGTGGNLVKDTNSTQVLSGSNGYTGTTTVSAGTLEVTGTLSGTTGVTVNTSGTLLLNNAATPAINSAAPVTLTGGAIKMSSSVTGQTQSFGALTLSASSTLDFGTHASAGNTFNFSTWITHTSGSSALTIDNWTGTENTLGATGTDDRLIFTGLASTFLGQFGPNDIIFTGHGPGYDAIQFGGQFEIVPVPEPATTALIGSIALCALVGYRERRRFTGLGKRMAARK
jgi:autotransporter-associated beta strand protein